MQRRLGTIANSVPAGAAKRSFSLSPDEARAVRPRTALSSAARRVLRGAFDAMASAVATPHALLAEKTADGDWRAIFASGALESSPGDPPDVDPTWLEAMAASRDPVTVEAKLASKSLGRGAFFGGGLLLPNGRWGALLAYAEETGALSENAASAARFALVAGSAAVSSLPSHGPAGSSTLEERPARNAVETLATELKVCWWTYDERSGGAVDVSPGFFETWGHGQDAVGAGLDGFVALVAPEDRDRVLSALHLSQGNGFDERLRAIDSDGQIRWIWLRGRSLGAPGRIAFFAEDVTDRTLRDEVARDSEARAAGEARLSAASELAGGVAHEINNPLTVIVGLASQLRQSVEQGNLNKAEAVRGLERIDATARRISRIVSSLKQLGRRDVGLELERTPLSRVIAEVKDLVGERFEADGVRLEIAEVPASLFVDVHPTLMGQAVMNLLNNAADAVKGTPDAWVKVDWSEDERSNYLYVTDGGPGIPIKIRSRIFDPFFTTKGPNQGTGLGLSLSANIVSRHGGALRLDVLSPRTRFVIQLPKSGTQRRAA